MLHRPFTGVGGPVSAKLEKVLFAETPPNWGEPKLAGALNRRLQRRERHGERLLFNLVDFLRMFKIVTRRTKFFAGEDNPSLKIRVN